jgi:serine protease Do
MALLALCSHDVHALEAEEVFQRVAPAVVLIVVSDGLGRTYGTASGIVVAPGEIVTNCHAVAGAPHVAVTQGGGGKIARASLRYADPERDLCQLSVADKTVFQRAITDIGLPNDIRVGARVYAIGAPHGMELTISEGIVSSLREHAGIRVIQTTAAISPGSSGGGLFDSQGKLVGITSFLMRDAQNLNFAYPAFYIRELPGRSSRASIELLGNRFRAPSASEDNDELRQRQARDAESRRQADARRMEELRRQGFAVPEADRKY